MPDLDLDPREHSSSYEVKPVSRWWLVLSLAFTALMAAAAGFFAATTWAMFMAGVMVTANAVMCFPRYFLSKRR